MTSCVFGTAILFALNLLPFPCEGKITSPPRGTRLTFLPGSTAKIQWTFDDDISIWKYRGWRFTSRNGSKVETFAEIYSNDEPRISSNSLPGVAIEKPATLVLKNIDLKNNGIYWFVSHFDSSTSRDVVHDGEVVVFVAVEPNVTLSCFSSTTLNEGDNFICVCRGEGGNPPANVTWYKDGVQIGGTEIEEQTLTLSNVDETDSGTYKCMAQSHINATDEKSIEVKLRLNFKPTKTAITLPDTVVVGKKVTITCESDGLPEPSYTIIHNETEVSSKKTHTISEVKRSDAGLYQCVAANKLGSNSKSHCLAVVGEAEACKKVDCESSAETVVVVWHIVVTLVSGIIIGILFSYIVRCSHRRWFRSRKPEPQTTEVDTTYQELDLTQMNKEENYQSLRLNIASNDYEESTYTELN